MQGSSSSPRFGSWHQPGQTQTAGTAITIPIPPYPGPNGGLPFLYALDSQGLPNWCNKPNSAFTKITQLGYSSGTTAHTVYVMRPLNWAVVNVAGAINTTSFGVTTDPGLYTTAANWKRTSSTPKNLATNGMATNDYFAVQLSDGTWFFDKCAGFSSLTVTTTTTIPNITGGGIPVGAIMFFFGIQTDKDPSTGLGQPQILPPIPSANTLFTQFNDNAGDGLVNSLYAGDPLYIYDGNATAAGIITHVSGVYSKV